MGLCAAVRPEALFFAKEGLPCKLMSREWLGSSQLLYLDSPEGSVEIGLLYGS